MARSRSQSEAIRTVLVEDCDDVRFLMGALLELDGRFDVVAEAADPRAALRVIARFAPDLVVVDLRLRRSDGVSVIRSLRQTRNRATIAVVTGSPYAADHDAALAAGADAVFGKECVITSLADSLADLCAPRQTGTALAIV